MSNNDFTDEQYLRLVNNTIIKNTEFEPSILTGGNTQITCNGGNSCKLLKFTINLFFGYDLKRNSQKYTEEIEEDMMQIWNKAILLKMKSKQTPKLRSEEYAYIRTITVIMNEAVYEEYDKIGICDDDVILCQITTKNARNDKYAVDLSNNDFLCGKLPRDDCLIRVNRLFTGDKQIVLKKSGKLKTEKLTEVKEKLKEIILN